MSDVTIPERAREIARNYWAHDEKWSEEYFAEIIESVLRSERELCQKIVEEVRERKDIAYGKAADAERITVAMCRQSDVETCEEILKTLREEGKNES